MKAKLNQSKFGSILKEHEQGKTIKEICMEHNISEATFYNWKGRYYAATKSSNGRIKELEAENDKLKKLYMETVLEHV